MTPWFHSGYLVVAMSPPPLSHRVHTTLGVRIFNSIHGNVTSQHLEWKCLIKSCLITLCVQFRAPNLKEEPEGHVGVIFL